MQSVMKKENVCSALTECALDHWEAPTWGGCLLVQAELAKLRQAQA